MNINKSKSKLAFDGQQEGERILFSFAPHQIAYWFAVIKMICFVVITYGSIWVLAKYLSFDNELAYGLKFAASSIVLIVGLWWTNKYYNESICHITERRIIRIEPVFPCFISKRMLFWNNVIKSKAVSYNILFRFFKIGRLVVYPISGEDEDVRADWVYYYEDLANFVDKVLFTYKQTPKDLANIREFVLKPKGQRFPENDLSQ